MAPWVDFLLQMGSTAAEATVRGRKKPKKGRDPKIDVAHNTFITYLTFSKKCSRIWPLWKKYPGDAQSFIFVRARDAQKKRFL